LAKNFSSKLALENLATLQEVIYKFASADWSKKAAAVRHRRYTDVHGRFFHEAAV
jgi:hypothetical protein